jgi:mRNA-degrading endonuclease toxin of MazEF toxin-antitoxin module
MHPAIVVTADAVLAGDRWRTVQVVSVTSNTERTYATDVAVSAPGLDRPSMAECHLPTTIAREQILEHDLGNVGPVALAQIRAVLADLLDLWAG